MRRTQVLITLAVVLLAVGLAGCGGDNGGGGDGPEAAETETTTEAEAPAPTGDADAGALVWEESDCGECHAFGAAGSSGGIGPNLDEDRSPFAECIELVSEGRRAMPSYADELSEVQIGDVCTFVVERAGG